MPALVLMSLALKSEELIDNIHNVLRWIISVIYTTIDIDPEDLKFIAFQ